MRVIGDKLRNKVIRWLQTTVVEPRKFPLSDFERIQYEIRPCDVLLIEGRNRVSQVIQMITQSAWTHAALYIGRIHDIDNHELRAKILQHYHGDPDAQLVIESVLGKGIIVTPITFYEREHIRICRPHGIARQDAQKVIAYAINRLGLRYDVRQIFDLARFLLPWRILPRRWRSSLFTHKAGCSTKESCSSLLAEAFQSVNFPVLPVLEENKHSGIELVHRNPRLFTPSDFDYSPFFSIIKYPIIELSSGAVYRNLPWMQGAISDDDGKVFLTLENAKNESAVESSIPVENNKAVAENKTEETEKPITKKSKTRRILDFFD